MLDKARKADAGRVRKLTNDGNKLIAMMDRELPEMHRLAWARVRNAPPELAELKKALRRMEKAIPANKRVMEAAAKELVADVAKNTGGVVLKVNGEEIQPSTAKRVFKIVKVAKSQDERPTVQFELHGPFGMNVSIGCRHDYDHKLKHKVNYNAIAKLRPVNGHITIEKMSYGNWLIVLPPMNKHVVLEFSTIGLTANHAFTVTTGEGQKFSFDIDIDYTAYKFDQIPLNGTNYTGYGRKDAIWGLPELKTFTDKFAEKQFTETTKKPQIGNKAIRDGVIYDPHNGNEHANGYAVDIDFKNTCVKNYGEEGYIEKNHEAQI